jgi:hypothetical protein
MGGGEQNNMYSSWGCVCRYLVKWNVDNLSASWKTKKDELT